MAASIPGLASHARGGPRPWYGASTFVRPEMAAHGMNCRRVISNTAIVSSWTSKSGKMKLTTPYPQP